MLSPIYGEATEKKKHYRAILMTSDNDEHPDVIFRCRQARGDACCLDAQSTRKSFLVRSILFFRVRKHVNETFDLSPLWSLAIAVSKVSSRCTFSLFYWVFGTGELPQSVGWLGWGFRADKVRT